MPSKWGEGVPQIVYLDQNKWIEFSDAEKSPDKFPEQFALLQNCVAKASAGDVVFPLSASNIYETFRISDPNRRESRASLQARLSGGIVFRARYGRLEKELANFLGDAYNLTPLQWPVLWFLSDVFMEAFADLDDPRTGVVFPERVINLIRQHPGYALHNHLTTMPDDERISAVKRWTDGSKALAARIEQRREQHKNETLAIRRRIYSAIMFSDEVNLLVQLAEKYGVRWNSMNDIGSSIARRLMNEVPIYYSERELVLRLEAQPRLIDENDMRDVDTYCAAIPYADDVIGENQFINLARQAGLGEKYNTRLETDLRALSV